jgi:hypothetical protein
MEDPEISPQSYSCMILDKGAKTLHQNEESLFNKWAGKTDFVEHRN